MVRKLKDKTILIDLDQVLVDFDHGCCKAHGTTKEAVYARRTKGEWELCEALGLETLGRPVTLTEFWHPINLQGSTFWDGLQPLPWIDELLALVTSYVDDRWHIVTAPSLCYTSYHGKVSWIKRKFGKTFDRFFITAYKELLAGDDTILIDDRFETCRKFHRRGSQAILFPTLGNDLHALADNPLSHVSSMLEQISNAS